MRKVINEVFHEICEYAASKNANGVVTSSLIGGLLGKYGYPCNPKIMKQLQTYCKENNRYFERVVNDDQSVSYHIGVYEWERRISSPTILLALRQAYTGKLLRVYANEEMTRATLVSSPAFNREIWVTISKFWEPEDGEPVINAWGSNEDVEQITIHF